MSASRDIHDVLRKTWGYHEFRPGQESIIRDVLAKNNTVALLPTGGGKSLCYQVPALAMEGVCIVVSPLIALMKDQVFQLKKLGVFAEALVSGVSYSDMDRILDNAVYGDLKFLYMSPERLRSELVTERIKKMNVNLLAIDEAHCISQWGHDFRPPYRLIHEIRAHMPKTPVIALTASATPKVLADVVESLKLEKVKIHRKSFYRDNIIFEVEWTEQPEQRVLDSLKQIPGTAIIYTRSRKQTTVIATRLVAMGVSATAYHAGLDRDDRDDRQAQWIKGNVRVMVATNAFGMGIDKADVRQVIHMELPDSPEAYYQEAGRGGRDGKDAHARIFLKPNAEQELRDRVAAQLPDLEHTQKVYNALGNHFQVAIGEGEGRIMGLDLPLFCGKYKFELKSTFNALQLLDRYGLIKLNENFRPQSTVFITMDRRHLYAFENSNPRYAALIQYLLRWYGGVCSGATRVDIRALEASIPQGKASVHKLLIELENLGILEYRPSSGGQLIEWLIPRMNAQHLPIGKSELKLRAGEAINRMESMLVFARHQRDCRFGILLEYFAEQAGNCGRCDNCRKMSRPEHNRGSLHKALGQYLEQPRQLEEIKRYFGDYSEKDILNLLGTLLDEGWVKRNDKGFYCTNSK